MILERLRTETRALHDRIEGRLGAMREGITREEVGQLLVRFYGYYRPWEGLVGRQLAGVMPAGFFEARQKCPLLENDLRRHLVGHVTFSSLPRCDRMPDLGSVERVLGSMYVIEGSTLGGQVIARHLSGVTGLEGGCSFFNPYGAETGKMWRGFQDVLRSWSTAGAADDEIVAAAVETFVTLDEWLHG